MSMNFYVSQINAGFQLLSVAVERTYLTGLLKDDNDKKLADIQFNWNGDFDHPRVMFTKWAKDCGWTKLYNKDWFVHDHVLKGLIEEGIVPENWNKKGSSSKKQTPKQQPKEQTTSQAPRPQKQVSDIVRQKVKVVQAPQAKQEQKEIKLQKPQKADNIVMMSDEQLAAEIHKISDFEDNFVDPDLL